MISLRGIAKSFDGGETFAVADLSLDIHDGEILVLLGSSGCGKTTTLKLINRLLEPTRGRIRVDDRDVTETDPIALRRSIGYVFQGIGLFPHLTVRENVATVPRLLRWARPRQRARADELLELVGLPPADYGDRLPAELSGGQQQRVGVARALAADPAYLLMDEPFGALDAVTRESLQSELLRLNRRLGKTVVFVTHDIFEALRIGDRIAVLHDGALEQVGARDQLVAEPASPFVRELFESPARQLEAYRDLIE